MQTNFFLQKKLLWIRGFRAFITIIFYTSIIQINSLLMAKHTGLMRLI
jgi:hypothetical protein